MISSMKNNENTAERVEQIHFFRPAQKNWIWMCFSYFSDFETVSDTPKV